MNLFKTLSKIYKAGMFHSFILERKYLSFKDCDGNLYVLQPHPDKPGLWLFRIGHVEEWNEFKPTYESEYSLYGDVPCAAFIDHIKPVLTDNPDFIKRASLAYLFN